MDKRIVGAVSLAVGLVIMSAAIPAHAQSQRTFSLKPNPATLICLQRSSAITPTATVIVAQGALTDDLTIIGAGIKPGLAFDLFTVQRSPLLSNGPPDPKLQEFRARLVSNRP